MNWMRVIVSAITMLNEKHSFFIDHHDELIAEYS